MSFHGYYNGEASGCIKPVCPAGEDRAGAIHKQDNLRPGKLNPKEGGDGLPPSNREAIAREQTLRDSEGWRISHDDGCLPNPSDMARWIGVLSLFPKINISVARAIE